MTTADQQRSFSWLAGLINDSEPRCGNVRVVAIDGRGAAGKSTFAARLHSALTETASPTAVLHTDDFASWDTFFGWWPRLEEQVLAPWARGEEARYRRYDWQTREFGPWESLPPPSVLILEGVGSGRTAGADRLSMLIWVQTDEPTRRLRAGFAMAHNCASSGSYGSTPKKHTSDWIPPPGAPTSSSTATPRWPRSTRTATS